MMETPDMLIERLNRDCDVAAGRKSVVVESLEFRRGQYGLNQAQFAGILKMHQSQYSLFVRGKRGLTVKAMRRAVAIGCPIESVLG